MNRYVKLLSAAVLLAGASLAHSQQADPQGPPDGGPGGAGGPQGMGGPDGGPPDPQQMMQMTDQHIRKALKLSDDSWSTLQPLIDKVEQLEHEADTGPLLHGHPHPPMQDGGDPQADQQGDSHEDNHPHSPVESKISSLKKLLISDSASDGDIQSAMQDVQDAEKKAASDLSDARKSLRAAVSLRQQATLVALGVLN